MEQSGTSFAAIETEKGNSMKSVYVTSVSTYSGKTALSLGLGLRMQAAGLSVNYLKPVSTQRTKWAVVSSTKMQTSSAAPSAWKRHPGSCLRW